MVSTWWVAGLGKFAGVLGRVGWPIRARPWCLFPDSDTPRKQPGKAWGPRPHLLISCRGIGMGMLRSYHPEHTGSHQNSEVKLDWAGLVLC